MCGEALIDLIPSGPGDTFSSPWAALSAGGPLNSAIALARLGCEVEFLGRLGSDAFARQIESHLRANGVRLDLAVRTPEATSLAIVSLDDAGHASYTFHFGGTANFGWHADELAAVASGDRLGEEETWLHVASLATVVEPGASALRRWVGGLTNPVSLDVNVRPTVIPDPGAYWAAVEPWLEILSGRGLLKASDEDLAFLAGPAGLPADTEGQAVELHRRYGIPRIALTLGPDGALGLDGEHGVVRVPGRAVDVVDTVGAGDTFMAGLLAALADSPEDLPAALRTGVAASALVCARRGANPPSRAEVDALVMG